MSALDGKPGHQLSELLRSGGFVLLLVSLSAGAQTDPGSEAFVGWSSRALVPLKTVRPDAPYYDLRPLQDVIGNADIVALSEADHQVAEALEFRNRLFRYLVENLGFTAIAIESGVTESRVVHDYVLGGAGELPDVLALGISWTFDRLPQNVELVRWMREYNADAHHTQKISFYGFDVPGSPFNPDANRGARTAIDDALTYLRSVDPAAAGDLHARLDWWLPHIRSRWLPRPHYTDLTVAERDSLTATVADLVTLFEHRQAKYIQASSETDYAWAYRSALGARAVDAMLRKQAAGNGSAEGGRQAIEVRDRMQAENVRWIVERQPPQGKVLMFAHLYHIATTSIPYDGLESPRTDSAVAGMYLRRYFGDRLVAIGNLFRRGTWMCDESSESREDAVQGSLAQLLGTLDEPLFLLDLRTAPAQVRSWLDQDRVLSDPYPWVRYELNVARGFDLLFYMDRVTPACPP